MLIIVFMVVGAVGVAVVWRLIAAGLVTIWIGQVAWLGAIGIASVATGRVGLSPRVWWVTALCAGLVAGVALYLATVAFVSVARHWPPFHRHVAGIYEQRRGLSLSLALVLSAVVVAPGEELFWRGLFQGRLAEATGWIAAAGLTWALYVLSNAAGGSLPILAAALVSGAVWGALALWTHGALASVVCHAAWTSLMIAVPPGSRIRRPRPPHRHVVS